MPYTYPPPAIVKQKMQPTGKIERRKQDDETKKEKGGLCLRSLFFLAVFCLCPFVCGITRRFVSAALLLS